MTTRGSTEDDLYRFGMTLKSTAPEPENGPGENTENGH